MRQRGLVVGRALQQRRPERRTRNRLLEACWKARKLREHFSGPRQVARKSHFVSPSKVAPLAVSPRGLADRRQLSPRSRPCPRRGAPATRDDVDFSPAYSDGRPPWRPPPITASSVIADDARSPGAATECDRPGKEKTAQICCGRSEASICRQRGFESCRASARLKAASARPYDRRSRAKCRGNGPHDRLCFIPRASSPQRPRARCLRVRHHAQRSRGDPARLPGVRKRPAAAGSPNVRRGSAKVS